MFRLYVGCSCQQKWGGTGFRDIYQEIRPEEGKRIEL
jgi:hypothetical protein